VIPNSKFLPHLVPLCVLQASRDFSVLTAVRIMPLWVMTSCNLIRTNVSERPAVSLVLYLEMKAFCSSEKLLLIYKITRLNLT